ncbi:MAG TPA: hypothetical protein VNW99_14135, partial [Cytophagaceae bacterium]|nr:hypothetical protein [Cytophagaceae bacterium]
IATQTIDESNMIASSVGASTINGAFVVFNGQQGIGVIATISQSNNIVNVVKSSTGVYTVTFSNPNNYTFYTLGGNAYWTALNNPSFIQVTRITSTTFNISVVNSTFTAFDSSNITAGIIFQST